jgi:hypothetical protein
LVTKKPLLSHRRFVDSTLGNIPRQKIDKISTTKEKFCENDLWSLLPLGNGVYFTAGIADEAHGLFGLITED